MLWLTSLCLASLACGNHSVTPPTNQQPPPRVYSPADFLSALTSDGPSLSPGRCVLKPAFEGGAISPEALRRFVVADQPGSVGLTSFSRNSITADEK